MGYRSQAVKRQVGIVLWVLLGAVALAPDRGTAEEAMEWMQKGFEAHKSGRFDEALKDFQRASVLRPQDPIVFYNMGVLAERLGRYEDAVEYYEGYLRWSPQAEDKSEVLNRSFHLCGVLGARSYQGNAYVSAIAWLKKAQAIYPDSKAVYFNLGKVYEATGEWREAVANYKKYAELSSPVDDVSIKELISKLFAFGGKQLLFKRDYQGALAAFQEARVWNDKDPTLYYSLARTHEQLGNLSEARDLFLTYLGTVPEGQDKAAVIDEIARISLRLGSHYLEKGETEKAVDEFRRGAAAKPDDIELRWALEKALISKGRIREALEELQHTVDEVQDQGKKDALRREIARLYVLLADQAYREGDYPGALEQLKEAVARDPENSLIVFNMARVYEKLQVHDEAITAYRRYLTLYPDARDRKEVEWRIAYLLSVVGMERFRKGEYEKAQGSFEQALAMMPEERSLLYNLAVTLLKSGKAPQAVYYFERYLETESNPQEIAKIRQTLLSVQRQGPEDGIKAEVRVGSGMAPDGEVPPSDKGPLSLLERVLRSKQAGRSEEALAGFAAYVRQRPAEGVDPGLRTQISLLHKEVGTKKAQEGSFSEAIYHFTKAREYLPSDGEADVLEARVYERLGDIRKALDTYTRSLGHTFGEQQRQAIYQSIIGILTRELELCVRRRDFQGALQVLDRLEPYLPEGQRSELLYQRARLNESIGRAEKASVQYSLYVEKEPKARENPMVARNLLSSYPEAYDPQTDPGTVEQFRAEGRRALQQGEYLKALRYLSAVKRSNPRGAAVHIEIADTLRKLGMEEEANRLLLESASLKASLREDQGIRQPLVKAFNTQAKGLFDRGLYERALSLLEEVAKVFPDDGPVRFNTGQVLRRLENHPAAIDNYEQYLALTRADPRRIGVVDVVSNAGVEQAIACYKKSMFREALEGLLQAEKASPGRADIQFNLGLVYQKLQMPQEALEHFRNYLARAPDCSRKEIVKHLVGEMQTRVGRYSDVRFDGKSYVVNFVAGDLTGPSSSQKVQQGRYPLLEEVLLSPVVERGSRSGEDVWLMGE